MFNRLLDRHYAVLPSLHACWVVTKSTASTLLGTWDNVHLMMLMLTSCLQQVLELGQVGRTEQDSGGKTPLFFHGTAGREARGESLWETVKESAQTSSEVKRVTASKNTASVDRSPCMLI